MNAPAMQMTLPEEGPAAVALRLQLAAVAALDAQAAPVRVAIDRATQAVAAARAPVEELTALRVARRHELADMFTTGAPSGRLAELEERIAAKGLEVEALETHAEGATAALEHLNTQLMQLNRAAAEAVVQLPALRHAVLCERMREMAPDFAAAAEQFARGAYCEWLALAHAADEQMRFDGSLPQLGHRMPAKLSLPGPDNVAGLGVLHMDITAQVQQRAREILAALV